MNLHKGHKVIQINDEEALKKENISVNDFIKDFDTSAQNVTNIKNKIENEINEINAAYEKVDKQSSEYFELKHKELKEQEKEMKDKLQTEVTKIKSKLEEYRSLTDNLIKTYERINKGIKTLNKEEENQNIKLLRNLTYVSKINKNQKEMNKITQILMKNLKLDFKEDNINYEEYYFNGLSVPKDIQVNDIKYNSFTITWKIDDINILNIDKNKIKYKIELRKENEKFQSIYEGTNMNYTANNLSSNKNYELRICSIYNDINSTFSEIKKAKTESFNSVILNESKRCDEFLNKLHEWTGGKNMELLYRGTRDGMSGDAFHNRCNNKGQTICLFQNDKNHIFGGYASIDWQSSNSWKSDSNCFLFTLTNMYNIEPTKFPNSNSINSIYDNSSNGPRFGGGHDICISFPSSHYANFPNSYTDVLNKGKSIFTGDNNNRNFNLKEIEVFKLIK